MKTLKKTFTVALILLPSLLFADTTSSISAADISETVLDIVKVVIPSVITVILAFKVAWSGAQYMLKSKEQRQDSDTKQLMSDLATCVIGAAIAYSAAGIGVWIYSLIK